MPKHNGVNLGARSPLLTARGVKRKLTTSESDIQSAFFEVLVGPVRAGRDRVPGEGLTGRIPDLGLIYAIPNSVGASEATQAKRKAEGTVPNMPDVHWPVMRGPFIGLYLEAKRVGGYPTIGQRAKHQELRDAGHCVVIFRSAQQGMDMAIRYHNLGYNRPSVRGATGWAKGTPLVDVVRNWRTAAELLVGK